MANTDDQFSGVMVDFPSPETGGGKVKRGADRHYPVIKKWQKAVEVTQQFNGWSRLGEDCHGYFWATNNYMEWALKAIEALDFRVISFLPWVKPGNAGLGQYFRGCNEHLIFCVRGSGYAVKTAAKDIRSDYLVGAPRPVDPETGKRIHSAKPIRGYELVEERTTGHYLEAFARPNKPERDRWSLVGDEIMVDGEPAAAKSSK